jgi:D-cysteine desulfhydrase
MGITRRMIPLFEMYPKLKENIPFISLGKFPTPVNRMDNLGKALGLNNLYVKRDDQSADLYGGNKVRKLEFLLADAINSKKKAIITFGCAGSNHTLATTLYSKKLNLRRIVLLLPQPNSHYIRKNLLMSFRNGADLHHYKNVPAMYIGCGIQFLRYGIKDRKFPKIIMPGGSTPIGTLGFVNAAFELKNQIDSGIIPEPDYIYFPMGTVGTAAGFTLGTKALGLKSKVISVRVTGTKYANAKIMLNLVSQANDILCKADSTFPKLRFTEDDIHIRHSQYGKEYALFTNEGMAAVSLMKETEGITLDGTYTGKTLASLMEDAKREDLSDKVILFWNTYNSVDFTNNINNVDYRKLPSGFHKYFEEDVQPLDGR